MCALSAEGVQERNLCCLPAWPDHHPCPVPVPPAAAAAGNYQLATAEGNLKSFNSGTPLIDMGAYVGFANTKDWAPGVKRTYYFYSYFAQGANPKTQARDCWHLPWPADFTFHPWRTHPQLYWVPHSCTGCPTSQNMSKQSLTLPAVHALLECCADELCALPLLEPGTCVRVCQEGRHPEQPQPDCHHVRRLQLPAVPGLLCCACCVLPASGAGATTVWFTPHATVLPASSRVCRLVNQSKKTIPAGFTHRFGVQVSP
jgi:hypothetical protein